MNRVELKHRAMGAAGTLVLKVLGSTFRYEVEGAENYLRLREQGRPFVYTFWHSRLLPLVHLHRNEGAVALVSEHHDGEYIARVMRGHGLAAARGSSTRGGARGLRQLLKAARSGRDLAITPDGPRGPARKAKLGALTVARLGGVPLVPMAIGGRRVWRLDSWDRFMVPKPFARLKVRYAPPIEVPRECTETELEALRQRLETVLNRITDEVDGVAPEGMRSDPCEAESA